MYVDGARFLPENCSFTRVVVHGLTCDGGQFVKPMMARANVSLSKARSPFFGLRNELRYSEFDSSSFFVFTIETYDLSSSKYAIVGHSCLLLFTDGRKPILTSKVKKFSLLTGNFQLPIFSSWPSPSKHFSIINFDKQGKIPCATLLVRIRKAVAGRDGKPMGVRDFPDIKQAMEKGVLDPPLKYQDGQYNTGFTGTTDTEYDVVYRERNNREDPVLKELIFALFGQRNRALRSMSDGDISDWGSENILSDPCVDLNVMNRLNYLDM